MLLRSLPNLHYPITVTGLLFTPNDYVSKNAPIFNYTYKSTVKEYDNYGEATDVDKTFPTRYEAQVEGNVVSWKISKGTVIERPGVELVEINEPCQHNVQFGGMCADCGKDMTSIDYGTSVPDHLRANVSVAHSNQALRVTRDEAQRNETAAKRRLLESKKLSLVVDLDQTIIHATVDPTVGEWMDDETNPNHNAVKDVQKFQLTEEQPGHDCWYYVKMRPGLLEFLDRISQLYELHIYTMGTRAYAKHIANIVDPQKKIFADRILSRDENGSLTAKNLNRLFPVDTRMVLIIDDRGDVWDWSKSLIKVVPYDFFKGIGDINSSFLPRRQDVAPETKPAPAPPSAPAEVESTPGEGKPIQEPSAEQADDAEDAKPSGESSTVDKLMSMGGANDEAAMKEKTTEQDEQLADQIASRPLMQQQLELEKDDQESEETANGAAVDGQPEKDQHESPKPRHNLLVDDDVELQHLETALGDIHRSFYDIYRGQVQSTMGAGRVSELKGEKSPKKRPDTSDMSLVPDVQIIMPEMKAKVLTGCNIVFSGIIPLNPGPGPGPGPPPESHDIWRWATSFGATVTRELTENTSHVVATRERCTTKMTEAALDPSIKIVSLDWLTKACTTWLRPDEQPYIIPVTPRPKRKRRARDHSADSQASKESSDRQSENGWTDQFPTLDTSFDDTNEDFAGGEGDGSPINDVDDDDWAKMAQEFDDDDDEDEEDEESGSETTSQADGDVKKRKRDRDFDTESVDGGNDSDTSSRQGGRKKKRREANKASGLSQVTNLEGSTQDSKPPTSSPLQQTEEDATNGADGESDDSGYDVFQAELELAMAEDD